MKTGRELTHEYRKFYGRIGFRVTSKGMIGGLVRENKGQNIPKGYKGTQQEVEEK